VAADGSTLPVMLASARVGAGRTTDAGSLLIVTDLSSVRRAEARLHAVERQFKTVFERAPLGISIVGLDGRVFEVNEAMCDLTGFAADHLEGQTTESLFVDDDRDRIEAVRTALFVEGDAHTMMELRIKAADGSIRWVLTDTSVVRDDDDVPMYLVTLTADINERKLFEARLAHDASHDALTGLPNRVTMVELIEQALARSRRRGGTLAVMFIDLDRFKAVNDTMGHSAGDEVLIQAGNRIRGAVRLGDVVARYGGDEFVALCEDIGGPIGSGTVAARICEAIGGQFVVEDDFARIGASVGISLNDGTGSASDLLARADAALYEAKQSGRGRYVIAGIGAYSPDSAPAPATATATGAGISSRSPTP
jgi:diguanylate cyclase (GGDEF)-like protein/PAS domain S-box-containing protein